MFKKKYRLTDLLTLLYLLINILIISFGWNHVLEPKTLLIQFCAITILVLALIEVDHFFRFKLLSFIRDFYPIFLLGFFFESTSNINKIIFSDYLDPFFQKIDYFLFGYQPALVWGKLWDNYFWQEFFHFSYFSYYLMILCIPLYFYITNKKAFQEVLFSTLFVFYLCFLIYCFLPVVGARYFDGMKELTTLYRYGPFTHIMAFVYKHSPHMGGAFPSSHVAVAFSLTFSSFSISKYLGWSLIVVSILLSISTVFCHYHYLIDAICGFLFAVLVYPLSLIIYRNRNIF